MKGRPGELIVVIQNGTSYGLEVIGEKNSHWRFRTPDGEKWRSAKQAIYHLGVLTEMEAIAENQRRDEQARLVALAKAENDRKRKEWQNRHDEMFAPVNVLRKAWGKHARFSIAS